jgi:predicted nucleic acid-binding protein
MPVVDTEILFALDPKDSKHTQAMRRLRSEADLKVPDAAVLEFQLVLRARGKSSQDTKEALLAVSSILLEHNVAEVRTIDTSTLALQCEIESKHGLSYFDSLIAASTLSVDGKILSDDRAFDAVPGIARIPLK